MNRKRLLVPVFASFVCIAFALAFERMMQWGVPHASASGEHLSISRLGANEEIVVSRALGGRGEPIIHEYRFGIAGDPRRFIASAVPYSDGDRSSATFLADGTLTETQAEGLEELLSYFRVRREERSSDPGYYDITYFRDGEKIGHEHFIGFWLANGLTELRRLGPPGDADYEYDYSRLARDHDIPRWKLDRMVTFDMLEKGSPNNTLEGTP